MTKVAQAGLQIGRPVLEPSSFGKIPDDIGDVYLLSLGGVERNRG